MDILNYATVLPIIIICYAVGVICKAIDKLPDKFIPAIVAVVGGAIAVPALYFMPEFPATDVISAIAVGIASGLVSTGVNQIGKQITKKEG